jgi:hypothetical protein
MDYFISQKFNAVQLGSLNRCRLYLQVITLSDIVDAAGLHIIPDILIGIPLSDCRSTLKWPNQQRPPQKDWTLWMAALHSLQPKNRLLQPLGSWLVHHTHQIWSWFCDNESRLLRIDHASSEWQVFRQIPCTRRTTRSTPLLVFDHENGCQTEFPSGQVFPATVSTHRYTNITTASTGTEFPSPTVSAYVPTESILAIIQRSKFYQDAFHLPGIQDQHIAHLATIAQGGNISGVVRTYYTDTRLTYTWSILSGSNIILSDTVTKGPIHGISSPQRLELEGFLAVL